MELDVLVLCTIGNISPKQYFLKKTNKQKNSKKKKKRICKKEGGYDFLRL